MQKYIKWQGMTCHFHKPIQNISLDLARLQYMNVIKKKKKNSGNYFNVTKKRCIKHLLWNLLLIQAVLNVTSVVGK